jgi:hypothetical protein
MTNWRQTARKKYPKLTYTGGDGGPSECWVVLAKCQHSQTNHWRYCLAPTKEDATQLMIRWDLGGCGGHCKGEMAHSLWKLNAN